MIDPDFDNWIHEVRSLPRAACVLVRRSDGMVLGVSRKESPDEFGMPGGKVDSGETMAQAAIRELREETGLTLQNPRLIRIYVSEPIRGGKVFACGTYEGDVTGDIVPEEGVRVEWVTPAIMMAGPFGIYNLTLFRRLGMRC